MTALAQQFCASDQAHRHEQCCGFDHRPTWMLERG
jgi:hypothetical protein